MSSHLDFWSELLVLRRLCLDYAVHQQQRGITAAYSYDAYGVMLGGNPTSAPTTSLLYAGEQFDINAQMYYLRARWYDPLSGRFNRMDPFAGSRQDPQSLHKYLYCHANPVNAIDPSGKFTIPTVVVKIAIAAVLMTIRLSVVSGESCMPT